MLASKKANVNAGLIAIGMTLFAFATAVTVRFRRGWQPAPVLPTGAGHVSDMLLAASDDHALELKSQGSTFSGEAESRQRLKASAEEIEAQPLCQEDSSSSASSKLRDTVALLVD